MIVVSAMITIAEGKGDEYVAHFAKLAPLVRKDPGCLTYVLHRKIGSPDQFFVFEQYESEDAIKHHSATPHFPHVPPGHGASRHEPRRQPLAGHRLTVKTTPRRRSNEGIATSSSTRSPCPR